MARDISETVIGDLLVSIQTTRQLLRAGEALGDSDADFAENTLTSMMNTFDALNSRSKGILIEAISASVEVGE